MRRRAHSVVGGVGERERDRALERAVVVVLLPREVAAALERLARGVVNVEVRCRRPRDTAL